MSTSYNIEPPTTAAVVLHTSDGDIPIELFGKQAPLATRNFLQHCLDGYYDNTIFHRLIPGFIIQGGDPSGLGTGGESAIDPDGRPFPDEFHPRLKFGRRGLVGMANMGGKNENGSQFFFTLGATNELTGKNTLFGRVAGDGIYVLMKMAEMELASDGQDRPMYPTKVTGADVTMNPFDDIQPRGRLGRVGGESSVAVVSTAIKKKKGKTKKPAKSLLSFGDDEDEMDRLVETEEHISLGEAARAAEADRLRREKRSKKKKEKKSERRRVSEGSDDEKASVDGDDDVGMGIRKRSPSPSVGRAGEKQSPSGIDAEPDRRAPKRIRRESQSRSSDSTPLVLESHSPRRPHESHPPVEADERTRNDRSKVKDREARLAATRAEIAKLKKTMRRGGADSDSDSDGAGDIHIRTKEEATSTSTDLFEAMIPKSAIRGGRRQQRRLAKTTNLDNSTSLGGDHPSSSLSAFLSFKSKLEVSAVQSTREAPKDKSISVDSHAHNSDHDEDIKMTDDTKDPSNLNQDQADEKLVDEVDDGNDDNTCDLHFVVNCQSCKSWDDQATDQAAADADWDDTDLGWMAHHKLTFEKDRQGRAEEWRRKNEDELLVLDPREGKSGGDGRKRGEFRDREWNRDRQGRNPPGDREKPGQNGRSGGKR